MNGTHNTAIGPGAGALLTTESNCTFIGVEAGADMVGVDGVTIIGDGIRDLDPAHNRDTLFIGEKVAFGDTLFGQPTNLKMVVEGWMRASFPQSIEPQLA